MMSYESTNTSDTSATRESYLSQFKRHVKVGPLCDREHLKFRKMHFPPIVESQLSTHSELASWNVDFIEVSFCVVVLYLQ